MRADTFSWQSGDVYKSVYNHLLDDFQNGEIGHSDTDGGVTVFYRLCSDGHKICLEDQEQNVIDYYNANGSCWIYVLDALNKRFKLPRTKFGFTGYRDAVGNYVEAGLPNITGFFGGLSHIISEGAFENTGNVDALSGSSYGGGAQKVTLDASRSSSIYGNSNTVQPPATQMYLYFYVGDTVRNQTEIDVGEITEALDGKLDQDLSNASASFNAC